MRTVAWLGGLLVVAGLVFMAVAGFPGALPILLSAAALVAMIGLGGTMGGRHTPNVAPVAADHGDHRSGPEAGEARSAEGSDSADGVPDADSPQSADGGTTTR
jgi:hypothetical protein